LALCLSINQRTQKEISDSGESYPLISSHLWRLWWRELRWAVFLFVPIAAIFAFSEADLAISRALFFDTAHGRWIGAHNWWVEVFLHTGGRWAIRGVVVSAITLCAASFAIQRLQRLRRSVGYFAIASILSIGVVGLLKTMTNVDCPWDLVPFGGQFPEVLLFADRPDALRAGHCFPAAHSSSGYALLALYFAAREGDRMRAQAGLVLGIVCGTLFGLAQQSRGAHFVSHDVWSAFLAWVIATSVYVFAFRARLRTVNASEVSDGSLDCMRDRFDGVCGSDGRRGEAGIGRRAVAVADSN
jgi:membrane-associated PAP2 superfamily phosphatase